MLGSVSNEDIKEGHIIIIMQEHYVQTEIWEERKHSELNIQTNAYIIPTVAMPLTDIYKITNISYKAL